MTFSYRVKNMTAETIEKLKSVDGVESVSYREDTLTLEGKPDTAEIENMIGSDEKYTKYVISVEIDCAECARKVEEALKKDSENAFVSFSFTKGQLVVITKKTLSEIKEEARSIEEDIAFKDEDKTKKYTFSVSIDCAECAKKVENALNDNENVAKALFNYPRGKLTVETSLSEDEIKALCRSVEDEIEFTDDKKEKYVFSVSIDCAECAKKVEDALNTNENVEKAVFNYPKGKLTVITTLSEDEIKRICTEAEDEIEFLGEMKDYVFSVTIDCAECARKVEEALKNSEKVRKASFDYPKGKLYVTTTLSEEEVRNLCLSVEDEMVFHTAQKAQKKDNAPYRIAAALVFYFIAKFSGYEFIAVISYLIVGYDVLWKAVKNILKGKVFDENFLMGIATIAALAISSYDEAAAVMIFYQIGEYFQRLAVGSSRDSIGKLMDLSSDSVTVKKNGEWTLVKPEEVKVGDLILLKSGEKLAVDATVEEGSSFVDTRALTGESVPVKAERGTLVLSGSVNGENTLTLKAEKEYSESTASKIMKLVEDSEGKKAESEKFITKFSRYYTPSVCAAALLVAVLPPLFGLTGLKDSVYRAAMLLVISCPCALVLSVPLTYFASMGSFAKHGILVKGDDAIQNLAKTTTVAMDKTGTLTEGVFSVQSIEHLSCDREHLLDCVYALEKESTHPIATAVLEYAGDRKAEADNVHTINGVGIEGDYMGHHIKAGSSRIMENAPEVKEDGTLVYVLEDDILLGVLVISDKIRSTSCSTIRDLRECGVITICMLSGDRKERAETTAEKLGLDRAYGELLPGQKLEKLEELRKEGILLYVGDGINDAPALKAADTGVAMGGVGSDTAIEAADCVIMNDDLSRLPVAITIAKKTERITKENIYVSLIVKAVVFILAILGRADMWLAVIADTGVCLVAVANAMRAMHFREKKNN